MRFKGRYRSKKLINLKSVLQKSIEDEHAYASTTQDEQILKLNPAGDACNTYPKNDSWKEGRRIVELAVLAKYLDNCIACQMPLRLSACVGETRQGIGTSLHVECDNPECKVINMVPCGKKHSSEEGRPYKIWDMNSKLALGMLNAGIGESAINNILATLNIPCINQRTLKNRENEVGLVIEDVAQRACDVAIEGEKNETEGDAGVDVSIDGGWQRRGAGKSFNSLSGHSTAVGKQTGKCLKFGVLKKQCRVCSVANKLKKAAKKHLCRKNWSSSSKAMEPFLGVQLLNGILDKGLAIKQIIGDDDTTTLARAKKYISPGIVKQSDKNHIMKNLGNSLFEIKKKHKNMSSRTVKYLQKCFSYALSQNKENPDGLKKNILSITPHAFGIHDTCSESWCGYITNGTGYKHKTLPYGQSLKGDNLKEDLSKLFQSFCNEATLSKLVNLGCSNRNENLNQMIARKAPKTHHYSSSASLDYRVSAAVAQKNEGHAYVVQVNKDIGLSPGKFTLQRTAYLDNKKTANATKSSSRSGKLRRLILKKERFSKDEECFIQEGSSYDSNIDFTTPIEDQIIEDIPRNDIYKPNPLSKTELHQHPIVVFDLETTGLGINESIIQIAGISESNQTFERFVFPERGFIPKFISRLTNIELQNGVMFYRNNPVRSTDQKNGIEEFLEWIDRKSILVAHNAQFDARMIVNKCQSLNLIEKLNQKVVGFSDTLRTFKKLYPSKSSFKQEKLVTDILKKTYNAHNALEDVYLLKELVLTPPCNINEVKNFFFDVPSVQHKLRSLQNRYLHLPSFQELITKGIISKALAVKISSSGLSLAHLRRSFQKNGIDGVLSLLKDRANTQRKKIEKICNSF